MSHSTKVMVAVTAMWFGVATAAQGQIRITEYMYSGNGAEFVEFTNTGASQVDMAGWSFDDSSRVPGTVDLSAFGVLDPGESVILTDADDAATFVADWSLGAAVDVIAGSSAGLGRNDEINLYDDTDALVDRLTYGDEDFPGSERTNDASAWPCSESLGLNNIYQWNLSADADAQASYFSASGDLGSPGSLTEVSCGAPSEGACCLTGNCTEGLQVDCVLIGGVYEGDGTDCATTTCPAPSTGVIRITEFMYKGSGDEFIELTNLDANPIDMTGWSLDDDSDVAGTVDLSAFGAVSPGESVIVTDGDAATFASAWGLTGVQIIGNSAAGLGRNDQINVYDSSATLVDRLTYGDEDYPGTIRTNELSGWPCNTAVGADNIAEWLYASVGDSQSSFTSSDGDVGSPGVYVDHDCTTTPTGACCDDVGFCTDVTATACLMAEKFYQGDSTDCSTFTCPAPADGNIRITEYLYSGNGDEFVEFTNLDSNPVDLTGWSYDDDSDTPGTVDLSAFGIVAAGESVILTDGDAAAFEADWGLTGVKIIGGSSAGLGRNDEINLYDSSGILIDRLTYGDEDFPGTVRTEDASGWPCEDAAGNNAIADWFLSYPGDLQNCFASASGDFGNPGTFNLVACEICGNGRVDPGEDCDGGDCCTAVCVFVAAGTECRAAVGDCDVAEACDGASADCPADEMEPSTTECRAAAGDCDVAEFCDGASVDCPADVVEPDTTECRAAVGDCDITEFCDGVSVDCPADVVEPNTTECRASAGECDPAEFCSGSDGVCPDDSMMSSGTPCSDDGNECTSDVCDGENVYCTHFDNELCGACCLENQSCRDDVLAATCESLGGGVQRNGRCVRRRFGRRRCCRSL